MSATEPADDATEPSGPDDPQRTVEAVLLGGGRVWTRRDIAERSGVGPGRTAQIWRALGFPVADEDARVFTDADVEALRAGERLIRAGLITEESETMMARALGHHLSRLAEWQVHTLWAWMQHDSAAPWDDEELMGHAAALLPEIELLQRHVWRRHLAASTGRLLAETQRDAPARRDPGKDEAGGTSPPREGADVRDRAVGFTDMVGYTRMTRGLDSTELVQVLDRFEGLTGDVVAEGRGRVVKTIGDEVLFVCESAQAAADIALELAARAEAEQALPRLRTGLAHGAVLSRFGDVYGAAVNIAARLTAVARPGTVLVNTVLAGELAGMAPYELKVLRPVSVRGYSRLRPVLLRPARPAEPRTGTRTG
ncbi:MULTISPECIES: adenylate/guanylate cyclase domain-containing protein [unclassified Streptomyces]|uniref:adenylate/guanylate cyclase domain-containing protein n=1 Tax=unclassified Streptomyces TaxID=2593676 RepID=UPI0035DC7A93